MVVLLKVGHASFVLSSANYVSCLLTLALDSSALQMLFPFLLLRYWGSLAGDGHMATHFCLGGQWSCGPLWGSQFWTIDTVLLGHPPKAHMWPPQSLLPSVLENLIVSFSHHCHLRIFLAEIIWFVWFACCCFLGSIGQCWLPLKRMCVCVDCFIQCCSLSQDAPGWNAIEHSAAVTVQTRVSRTGQPLVTLYLYSLRVYSLTWRQAVSCFFQWLKNNVSRKESLGYYFSYSFKFH